MTRVRRKVSIVTSFVMAMVMMFSIKPPSAKAVVGEIAIFLTEVSIHILLDQTVEFVKKQATGEAAEQEAVIEEVYEISEMTEEILESVHEMEDMLGDLQASVTVMQQDINELKTLITQEFADLGYNLIIDELEDVDNFMEPHWDSYTALIAELKDPTSAIYNDPVAREQKIDDVMTGIHNSYSSNTTFESELNVVYSQMSGTTSLVDARMDVDKSRLPFEHQIYDNASSALNYGVALQAKLMHLYWEVTGYMQTKHESTPNLLPNASAHHS